MFYLKKFVKLEIGLDKVQKTKYDFIFCVLVL